MECNNDINSMIDIAKVADIVLLMIDGNFGFEMETMEFLNILAPHGLPSHIFGILTHLDLFKSQSILKTTKKRLKHRFWSELYQGAKLFYLSGVMNGRYPDREIHNLSRFISVMKNPRPIKWRNDHFYLMADRMVDLTYPAEIEMNRTCDRQVALYGYIRGQNFPAQNGQVHIPGVGDLSVASVEQLPDPCPTPYQDKQAGKTRRRLGEKQKLLYAPMRDVGGVLVDKDAVYVAMPTQTFDPNAIGEDAGMGERLVVGLQQGRGKEEGRGMQLTVGGEILRELEEEDEEDPGRGDTGRTSRRSARLVIKEAGEDDEDLFEGEDDEDNENEEYDSADEGDDDDDEAIAKRKPGRALRNDSSNNKNFKEELEFADSDSDLGSISGDEDDLSLDEGDIEDDSDIQSDDEGDDDTPRWKDNLAENARKLYASRRTDRIGDLSRMLYDESLTPAEVVRRWRGEDTDEKANGNHSDEDDGDGFFNKVEEDDEKLHVWDRSLLVYDLEKLNQRWSDQDELEALRKRFITANLLDDREAADAAADGDGEDGEWGGIGEEDSDGDGDFEDLETGEKHPGKKAAKEANDGDNDDEAEEGGHTLEAERARNARRKEELRLRFEEEDREGLNRDRTGASAADDIPGEEFGEDDWYAEQKHKMALQSTLNKTTLEGLDPTTRVRVAGYSAGAYCRIVLASVPCEFVNHFDSTYPLLLGGLTPTEQRFGYIQVRIKRHRWHKKILKTNDPLIFSLGWRRFQALPVYSISDSRTRDRMLKYTPEHMHCFGTFWGPLIDVNTGFCAVQTLSRAAPGFRVAATGVILNVEQSTEIVKKLKLTGLPVKIFKNTAFIRDMFTSALENLDFRADEALRRRLQTRNNAQSF